MADIEELYSNKAQEIAEQRYGREFNELPPSEQMRVWMEAEHAVVDDLATQADLLRDSVKERL